MNQIKKTPEEKMNDRKLFMLDKWLIKHAETHNEKVIQGENGSLVFIKKINVVVTS